VTARNPYLTVKTVTRDL